MYNSLNNPLNAKIHCTKLVSFNGKATHDHYPSKAVLPLYEELREEKCHQQAVAKCHIWLKLAKHKYITQTDLISNYYSLTNSSDFSSDTAFCPTIVHKSSTRLTGWGSGAVYSLVSGCKYKLCDTPIVLRWLSQEEIIRL